MDGTTSNIYDFASMFVPAWMALLLISVYDFASGFIPAWMELPLISVYDFASGFVPAWMELSLIYMTLLQGSFLHVVPPMILFLAKHPMVSGYDLDSVKTLFTGAAPVGAQSVEQVVSRLSSKPTFRQGMPPVQQ
jgi:hypothetical protein